VARITHSKWQERRSKKSEGENLPNIEKQTRVTNGRGVLVVFFVGQEKNNRDLNEKNNWDLREHIRLPNMGGTD